MTRCLRSIPNSIMPNSQEGNGSKFKESKRRIGYLRILMAQEIQESLQRLRTKRSQGHKLRKERNSCSDFVEVFGGEHLLLQKTEDFGGERSPKVLSVNLNKGSMNQRFNQ